MTDGLHQNSAELEFLFGRINYELRMPARADSAFHLATMRRLLELLGDPHKKIPAIHVAGTKGKGSVATMMEAILRSSGHRVGKYTSPHLESIRERFIIDGEMITDQQMNAQLVIIIECVQEIDRLSKIESSLHPPTFFEISTAVAFCWFAQQKVDYAVLEVGLGGRLDSTNVCCPIITFITNISFDHVRQLGNNLRSIAREKAGIIKPGVPLVTAVDNPEALDEIRRIASGNDSPIYCWKYDFEVDRVTKGDFERAIGDKSNLEPHASFDVFGKLNQTDFALRNLSSKLRGRHQMQNAVTAIIGAKLMQMHGHQVTEDAIRLGIETANQPGRIEMVSHDPTVVLDVAHNVASAQSLVQWIVDMELSRLANRRSTLVFASSRDKDLPGILNILLPHFETVVLTRFGLNPRACPVGKLHKIAKQAIAERGLATRIICADESSDAWYVALDAVDQRDPSNDFICVAGSVFLVADLRELVLSHFQTQCSEASGEN